MKYKGSLPLHSAAAYSLATVGDKQAAHSTQQAVVKWSGKCVSRLPSLFPSIEEPRYQISGFHENPFILLDY